MQIQNISFSGINSNAFRQGMILRCAREHFPETHKLNSTVRILTVKEAPNDYIDITFRRGRKTDYNVSYPKNYMDDGLDLIDWVKEKTAKTKK